MRMSRFNIRSQKEGSCQQAQPHEFVLYAVVIIIVIMFMFISGFHHFYCRWKDLFFIYIIRLKPNTLKWSTFSSAFTSKQLYRTTFHSENSSTKCLSSILSYTIQILEPRATPNMSLKLNYQSRSLNVIKINEQTNKSFQFIHFCRSYLHTRKESINRGFVCFPICQLCMFQRDCLLANDLIACHPSLFAS